MPLNTSSVVVPAVLGVSLVAVSAFVAYYLLKKDDEESDKSIKTSRVNVIEVQVPKSIVPALIGRSGSNIKEIEKKSGALIHFKKFTDKEYDVCIIRGRSEAAQLAETTIHEFIKRQPVIVEDSMEVPSWACGRIIGTGGESINEISHRSGARVKLEGGAGDAGLVRRIALRGTAEQIQMAKTLVDNIVSLEKCRREIEQSKRSPRHATTPSPSPSPTPPVGAIGAPAQPISAQPGPAATAAPFSPAAPSTPADTEQMPETDAASIQVYVSAVSSPSRFWVQMVGAQVTQLDDLVNHMTDYYGNKDNRDAHQLSSVSVGQVVAAVFRHDGRWYRARVHDIRPNEFDNTQQVADVFYVDYGDSEYVSVHELCELRADLLRLRFQAMECYLGGVRPTDAEETEAVRTRWYRWPAPAIERFEELTQVARWKALTSVTCSYQKSVAVEGEKEKEIPGIKLYDVTEEGELDIGGVLVAEGWAVCARPPRAPPRAPPAPFGDLGNSRILGILGGGGGERASSLPKDHKDDRSQNNTPTEDKVMDSLATSKSLSSGLDTSTVTSISNFDLTNPTTAPSAAPKLNGSHHFLNAEKLHLDLEKSSETLVPRSAGGLTPTAVQPEELKANMNRIDSHHSGLDTLVRGHINN